MHYCFWQTIVSHQMMALADGLVDLGCDVTYVAEQALTADRVALGWQDKRSNRVKVIIAADSSRVDALLDTLDGSEVHLCQGLRGNWFSEYVVGALGNRRCRYWIVMETMRNKGAAGLLRRIAYARLLRKRKRDALGILAIGHRTTDWVVARGFPSERVHPFAYFMAIPELARKTPASCEWRPVRFMFVGQLIPRKRLGFLIDALGELTDSNFTLTIIGIGEMEPELRRQAAGCLAGRVQWAGVIPASEVSGHLAQADCLVLPSIHDGWGTVVSEALIVGTPVICSDACGAAGVVRASGAGGVFATDDISELRHLLSAVVERGVVDTAERQRLRSWSQCLGGRAGAAYLLALTRGESTVPPWVAAEAESHELAMNIGT